MFGIQNVERIGVVMLSDDLKAIGDKLQAKARVVSTMPEAVNVCIEKGLDNNEVIDALALVARDMELLTLELADELAAFFHQLNSVK